MATSGSNKNLINANQAKKDEFYTQLSDSDHITPWHEGGKTTGENCQMLCKNCNRTKSGK